jgi:hypothetical protein
MLRVLTVLVGGAGVCLALHGCDWSDDKCNEGAIRCHDSTIEECEQTPNGYADWREVADCVELDARCVVEQGRAQCEYGLR